MSDSGVIIFDIDGTLFDSMQLYTNTFCNILDEFYKVPVDKSREIFQSTAGLPLDQQFNLAIKDYNHIMNYDSLKLVQKFWDNVSYVDVAVMPNAISVIRQLDKAGYHLVASSGTLTSVINERLKRAGVYESFKLILGTDYHKGGLIKGDSHIHAIMNALLLPYQDVKTSAVMIGDGAHDSILANRFGIIFIGYLKAGVENTKPIRADIYIHDLLELISLLSNHKNDSSRFLSIDEFVRIIRKE